MLFHKLLKHQDVNQISEKDDGKEYAKEIFKEFFNKHNIKRYSSYTDKGAVSVERFNRTIRNLMKKPVFEKGKADWVSELPSIKKKFINTIHNSTKMTPIQDSKKSNEELVYSNLQDRRDKQQPKFNLGQLIRTADIKQVFRKGDSVNYRYKLYTITEVVHDSIPSYEKMTIYPRDMMKIYYYLQN